MAQITSVMCDDLLLTFDGEIVEVFNFPGVGSARYHVRLMKVERGEPNRKGKVMVRIAHASRSAGGVMFEMDPAQRVAVEPFLDEVEREIARNTEAG